MTYTLINLIEWVAAVAAVAGTLLLARKSARAGWGFVLYLVSNAGWIASALHHGAWALLAQQAVFVATSLWGVWVWLVQPLLESLEIDE
jgi:nicotinamide riboside transporter PnuC